MRSLALLKNFDRALIAVAKLSVAVVIPLYAWKVWNRTDYTDFLVYHRAALRLIHHEPLLIYNTTLDGNSPFRYAPVTLWLFAPFGLFEYSTAKMLWFLVQALSFGYGFLILGRLLGSRAPLLLALTWLLTLRFFLDHFMIGQVTGWMFLAMALGLCACIEQNFTRAFFWLLWPASLKVGPAILLIWLFTEWKGLNLRSLTRLFGLVLLATAVTQLPLLILFHGLDPVIALWRDWARLLAADSSFFDASHYGSQSLNSMLLRLSAQGMFELSIARSIEYTVVCASTLAVVGLWVSARDSSQPKTKRSTIELLTRFSLGVMAYLVLMPFTFKYSLPLLAIPIITLLSDLKLGCLRRNLLVTTLGMILLTMSVMGLDVVGPRLFFWTQKQSIPAMALLLTMVTFAIRVRDQSLPKASA